MRDRLREIATVSRTVIEIFHVSDDQYQTILSKTQTPNFDIREELELFDAQDGGKLFIREYIPHQTSGGIGSTPITLKKFVYLPNNHPMYNDLTKPFLMSVDIINNISGILQVPKLILPVQSDDSPYPATREEREFCAQQDHANSILKSLGEGIPVHIHEYGLLTSIEDLQQHLNLQ